ncbi:HD domain-containing protein [Gracilibacillus xinjiangensis]|uniref:HD domain-containing protein n=1 Tax=Gracilibacillus xinjiangensis TaxID=1193282 RepID=A0ABV8X178_9BACI
MKDSMEVMMDKDKILQETERMVKTVLIDEKSGHDWLHIKRVKETALEIALKEGADPFVVTLAALLHDLADEKIVESEDEALVDIKNFLLKLGVDTLDIQHILTTITTMSFKGGNSPPVETLEAQVVQDADRLDAMGAIGIARCFIYAGKVGSPIYDPQLEVRDQMSIEEYRNDKTSAIHHFYEKLLKLKDLMNTKTAKELATSRHEFMEMFLEQFYHETRERRR